MESKKNTKVNSRISNLENRLQKMSVNPQPRKRNKRQRSRQVNIPAGFGSLSSNRARISGSDKNGFIAENKEFWYLVQGGIAGTNPPTFNVQNTNFNAVSFPGWIKGLAKNFERYDLLKCTLHYRTSVGTTTEAAITLAIDWDPEAVPPKTAAQVYVKDPIKRSAVWKDFDLPLPTNKLQGYKDMFLGDTTTASDSRLLTCFQAITLTTYPPPTVPSRTFGEVWISYKIRFRGHVLPT